VSRLQFASSTDPTIVLVHGAGHTSDAWRRVQDHLRHASLAIDLPGRRDRAGDLTSVTIDEAAASAATDVSDHTDGVLVLVAHSAGGIVLPALAARLGERVAHLVFVAGLCAREGRTAVETFNPGHDEAIGARLQELRERYRGHRFASANHADPVVGPGLAMSIDSLNYITQPVSWVGVSPQLPRTFVRPLRDELQSREVQARLAADCGAAETIDIDAGHNVTADEPVRLAAILDCIADGARDSAER
jgi:pimeloyl-ACP methyl ester carboxylesterase